VGTARFSAGLSAIDFVMVSCLLRFQASALGGVASDVMDFARREGLTAHARAVGIRDEG
jgi:histidinol dehydrogenase